VKPTQTFLLALAIHAACWALFIAGLVVIASVALSAPMPKLDYCGRAERYAQRVVAGKIPACEFVQLAAERQIRDRAQKGFAWRWSPEHGNRICAFVEKMPHVKGRWSTWNIKIEDWECFVWSTVFGWVDADGYRRFRRMYEEIPRKNGKTTQAAIAGLYLFALDGELGAEVYSAAVTRDQAKIAWGIADMMVRHKRLAGFRAKYGITPYKHHMERPDGSVFRPLSREADSLEGLNIHGGIVDELHAHKTREIHDVMDSATGSRR